MFCSTMMSPERTRSYTQFLRSQDLLERVRPHEQLRCVQRGVALGLLHLVEGLSRFVQLVLKQIGQPYYARSARIDQVGRVFGPAPSAPEQSNTHCGVGRRSAHKLWF